MPRHLSTSQIQAQLRAVQRRLRNAADKIAREGTIHICGCGAQRTVDRRHRGTITWTCGCGTSYTVQVQ